MLGGGRFKDQFEASIVAGAVVGVAVEVKASLVGVVG